MYRIELTDKEHHHTLQGLYRQKNNFIGETPDIDSAIAKVKGAVRLNKGRRAKVPAVKAVNDYRRSNLFVSSIRMLPSGDEFEMVPDGLEADAFALLCRDQCPENEPLSVAVDFFSTREDAETYMDAIAVEG